MRASRRALKRAANFEAVTLARKALDSVEEAGPEYRHGRPWMEAQLLLGTALGNAGGIRESCGPLRAAVEAADRLGDTARLKEAVFQLERSCFYLADPTVNAVEPLRKLLSSVDPNDITAECQIVSRLARASVVAGDLRSAIAYNERAEILARQTRDDDNLFEVIFNAFQLPSVVDDVGRTALWDDRADELYALAERLDDDDARGRALSMGFTMAAEMGNRDRMDRDLARLVVLGHDRERLGQQWVASHAQAMIAIMEGDFAGAERCAEAAYALGPQTYGRNLEGVYGVQMFAIRREQKRLAEVAPIIKRLMDDDPSSTLWRPGFALVASDLGYQDAARRILDEIAEEDFALPFDGMRSTTLAYLAEIAARLGSEVRSSALYALLRPYREMTITAGIATLCSGAAGRYLGNLSATTGDWETAADHYEAALGLNASLRAPVWLAHTQWDYASMLQRRGRPNDLATAERLYGEAYATAGRLGMVELESRRITARQ